jgi:hypothetical protein
MLCAGLLSYVLNKQFAFSKKVIMFARYRISMVLCNFFHLHILDLSFLQMEYLDFNLTKFGLTDNSISCDMILFYRFPPITNILKLSLLIADKYFLSSIEVPLANNLLTVWVHLKFWSLIGYSPQIYTQESVRKNRKHQSAETISNIPVKKKAKYFDNEENRTRKLYEAAQASKSACVNFFLPKRHRLFPRRRIFYQVTILAVTECTVPTVRCGITYRIKANHSRHEFSNHQIQNSAPTVNFFLFCILKHSIPQKFIFITS